MNRKTDEPAKDGEAFLSRWSRRKEEAREAPPAPKAAVEDSKEPAPELPPIEKLTMDSDYRAFFHPKVGEDVRRQALKKLFSDPHFNVMDGLDVYIDDYSKAEPIPPAMMAGLRQAQNIFQWAKEDREQREQEEREKLQRSHAREIGPPSEQPVRGEEAGVAAPDSSSAALPALSADSSKPAQS